MLRCAGRCSVPADGRACARRRWGRVPTYRGSSSTRRLDCRWPRRAWRRSENRGTPWPRLRREWVLVRGAVFALEQFGGSGVVGDLLLLLVPEDAAAGFIGDH